MPTNKAGMNTPKARAIIHDMRTAKKNE